MRHEASSLVHVPTALGDSQLAESYRAQGAVPLYTHPQAVSRYAIGGLPGSSNMISGRTFAGVGHE